ncbi:SSS sodium solute transporter superfamily protein (plasmid) [Cupriavidus necator N-1]|uniref:SSS sodium solute transporter superfamily protein n=1 Tax=Cupriavidus necator (strain ATCC 43291 / DSM 13513 / CCUG 52238 / LMG 8453 / N-1) TaxID=1042878 RepID=F8GXH8_CUPNN|nr:cation acetate symporter [Cupriavidus necator]AEI82048.1 SSS sodium solute transporter superfamily protein [Cupriavidus necator N-1]MDX6008363.1 cation acetate symporter [Cupriavidus necator]
MRKRIFYAVPFAVASSAALADNPTLVSADNRGLTFGVFAVLFLLTLGITWFAARRNSTASDFYTAGGGIGPRMNGLAIAGDYLSAAAFLGVSGLIALYGLDGISYVVGFFVSFIPVLILIAEPCRNLGKFTLGDVLAFRNNFRATKLVVAVSSILVALFYMVPQIVGGAVIVRALIGIPYELSVIAVGTLMLTYVLFGGMRATTSVQVLKAVLLITFCLILVILSWMPYGFNIESFFNGVISNASIQQYVQGLHAGTSTLSVADAGQRLLAPGLYLKNPLEQVSLGMALVLGTAAMPHILMRFFTVPNAKAARKSALYAMFAIGLCHLLIVVIGFSAALNVGPKAILAMDKGGNLAAPMLAQFLGGGPDSLLGNFMLAIVAAVSFATIVAVVAGLTLAAASSLAHDVYVGAIKNGAATEREQVRAARIATLLMAVISVVAGIATKGQNVAQLVGLGYAVAASANLPALICTLYWRRCNTAGVVAGVLGGTILSIGLVLISPNMTYPLLQKEAALKTVATLSKQISDTQDSDVRQKLAAQRAVAQSAADGIPDGARSIVGLHKPLIELRNPGIISIPFGFLLVVLFSLLSRSHLSESRWAELSVRRETGIGAAEAVVH